MDETTLTPDQHLRRLERALSEAMRKDQFTLRKRLDRARDQLKKGQDAAEALARVDGELAKSVELRQLRAASLPSLRYPEELPVVERRDAIREALLANQVIIVCGETGSGKTTQLPKICLEAGRGVAGYIGHTQPRRIAARTVAVRIAEELGQPLGQSVGYKVRFHDQTRPDSLIKLMTDGILLAETQNDRFLDQYDTLIIDEAHERSLNIDFLIGYVKWLLPRRRDLKLIITSATIDPERFSRHFDDAPIIHASGRTYPVDVRYRPVGVEEAADETDRSEQRAIVEAVDELWREGQGDILIFLSGEREIRETAESLRKHHPHACEILPLFSRLSGAEQERVFKPRGQRRIVLATNVAETSLTVPGIRSVIDTGYARISRYSARSKLQRLPIEKVSQASANQRSGRCGRLGPGICIRLYSEMDFQGRPVFTEPEILRTNLAAVILQMKVLGLGDISRFPFIEPPDDRAIRDGLKTLQEINALDAQGGLTEIGRRLAKFPLDPRLGRMLLAAADEHCLAEVAIVVAALSVQDPRERPVEKAAAADQSHARFRHEHSDFLAYLNLWKDHEEQKKHLSNAKLRAYCRDHFLSYLRMREWQDIEQQIMQVVKGDLALRVNQIPGEYPQIHRALLTGLLSNVGFKHEQSEYLGARGLKFQIHPGSFLFKARPKWIMTAEQVETTKVYGRTVAKIEPEWIETCGAHLIKRQHYDPHWERKQAGAVVHERTTLFSLTVQSGRLVPYEKIDPVAAREIFIRSALVQMDYDSKAPFMTRNRELLTEAEYLQQKGRRVDLVVDEDWIYRFFDERVPATVVNGITFEKWRRDAERQQPKLLFLTRDDITQPARSAVQATDFPDELKVGQLTIALQYRFEPGHEDDGVTAIVPLHCLNQLAPEPFQWLVPGLFPEKVVGLIKSLPKTYRIHFVPAPDFAERVLPMLDYRRGSLFEQLSGGLRKLGKLTPPTSAFDETTLPVHLRMNFALVDENQRVVGRSRDLAALQCEHSRKAVDTFTLLAASVVTCTRRTAWDFDDLPAVFDGTHDGQAIHGYQAIIDEGDTVGVKVFDTEAEAALQHEQGLIRLFRLSLNKELKYLRKNLVVGAAAELAYRQLPAHPLCHADLATARELRDDLLDRIVGALFVVDPGAIRTRAAFDATLAQHRGELVTEADKLSRLVDSVLTQRIAIARKLEGRLPESTRKDLREQLALMIFRGFVVRTPARQLTELPRYLKAMDHRLDKAQSDPGRDQKLMVEVQAFWTPYWTRVKADPRGLWPERDEFRWSLEEYRVSLFAQMLKTAYPISAKRLKEAWDARKGKS
ncbi:ATP-dependent RNA helicase HrpA [Methylolobus aquaticus]